MVVIGFLDRPRGHKHGKQGSAWNGRDTSIYFIFLAEAIHNGTLVRSKYMKTHKRIAAFRRKRLWYLVVTSIGINRSGKYVVISRQQRGGTGLSKNCAALSRDSSGDFVHFN